MVRSRYPRGAVEVRSRCGRAVEVRSWYGPSTVEVRSWCASGSVRFVNFSTGDTVGLQIQHAASSGATWHECADRFGRGHGRCLLSPNWPGRSICR